MKKITKEVMYEIGWSYPSSINAKSFGFDNTGCYTVSLTDCIKPPKAKAGFATLEEARTYASTLNLPASPYSK